MLQAQNNTAEAQAAFEEYLSISQQLVKLEPTNADSQKHLAAAYSRMGDIFQVQGKPAEAQVAFAEFLSISRQLAEQDSSNASLQQLLAAAHNRMGDVWQGQGKIAEAKREFEEYLAIGRHLVSLQPANLDWQRELAVACVKLARLVKEVNYSDSLPYYEEATSIFADLTMKAPGFAQWAKDRDTIEKEFAEYKSYLSNGQKSVS